MSTSNEERLDGLRIKALPYLITHLSAGDLSTAGRLYFDEALREARAFHEAHPVEQDVGRAPQGDSDALEIYRATLDTLRAEHRKQTMQPFIERNVPQLLAAEIVDELVLSEKSPAGN